ncbi:MAG TPA: DUF2336 domain-containing protein [Allosphingosinicella sp.]|jgi:hypothetical protein|nr:DUF2336 domain-containing protein [Allosphingosinicella sp.]
MSENRRSSELDGAARLVASARARLAAAAADLRLAESDRLTEWQRRTMLALLDRLIGSVEDDLRSGLAARLPAEDHDAAHAALSSAQIEIARPLLDDAAPWDPALVALLLRRAEEHRLQVGAADHALLVELSGSDDEAVAAAAMALLVAQSRRLDSFLEPLLLRTELPAELEHGLVWTIAASLRAYLVGTHDVSPPIADRALAEAAGELLARYDEGETFAALALRLARALDAARRLDGRTIARMPREAGLPLLLAALSVRSGLPADACWELVADPAARGAVLLLRAADLPRDAAAAILFALHGDRETVVAEFERFDGVDPADAAALLTLWRADPAYRAAVASLAA